MYKAIKEIGGYKIGEEIPTEKALAWIGMYAIPHVELVGGKPTKKIEVSKESKESSVPTKKVKSEESSDSSDAMLDDYLARGRNVVKKNISTDNLNRNQLEKLLKLEKSGKKRNDVILKIKEKLAS